MKKLMTMIGVVAFVACSYAATVTWTVAGVTAKETESPANYATYLFLSSSTAAGDAGYITAKADVISAIESGKFNTLTPFENNSVNAAGTATKQNIGSYKAGDVVKAYTVVFNNADVSKATYYAIAATDATASFTLDTGSKPLVFTGFSTANAWQSIPEPTSGLLLLLGVAGLALKRKRA